MTNISAVEVLGLLLGLMGIMWYIERKRRLDAEMSADIATRREALNGIQKKLDENKVAYDNALHDLPVIPNDMLSELVYHDPSIDTRPVQVASLTDSGPGTVSPATDLGGPGQIKLVH